MIWLTELYTAFRDFMEAGGTVLWLILAVTILMWTFIVERYWYFRFVHPGNAKTAIERWQSRKDTESWFAKRVRERMLSEVSVETHRYVNLIKTLIAVIPLLGLLGTVTGMIQVFDVMATLGTGNARAMASGISHATIPTMAAMTAAISGLYFSSAIDKKSNEKIEELADYLRHF